jgi:hypothetical protein
LKETKSGIPGKRRQGDFPAKDENKILGKRRQGQFPVNGGKGISRFNHPSFAATVFTG